MNATTPGRAGVFASEHLRASRPRSRAWVRMLTALGLLAQQPGCDLPGLLHPPASGDAALIVAFSRTAVSSLATSVVPDAIHVRILHGTETLRDSVPAFPGTTNEVRLRIEVEPPGDTASVDVVVELLEGTRVVARGSRNALLQRGEVTVVPILADDPSDNLALSDQHACYLDASGAAYCWGRNTVGQLGNGTTVSSSRPVRVAGAQTFVSIDAGISHTCALTEAGEAWCWGANQSGQLGNGTTTPSAVPIVVTGGLRFRGIGTGTNYTCGLTVAAEVYCWGNGLFGVFGPGVTSSLVPIPVGGTLGFDGLRVGFFDVCGLVAADAYCWGREIVGGASIARNTPTLVPGGLRFGSVSPGNRLRCGVTSDADAYCWSGDISNFGQLGNGSQTPSDVPVAVTGGLKFRSTSASRSNATLLFGTTCGLATDGRAWCWGLNSNGQLGTTTGLATCSQPHVTNGSPYSCSTVPVPVSGNLRFDAISVGSENACALNEAGVYCWGSGASGMLGQGDLSRYSTPVRVGPPITPPSIASFVIDLPVSTLAAGDSVIASARATDQHGLAIPAPALQWVSSDSNVVRVEPSSSAAFNEFNRRVLLRGRGAGSVQITATSTQPPLSANATIVATAPATLILTAITTGGAPVNVNNVIADFDVAVTLDPRGEEVSKLTVMIVSGGQNITAAELNFAQPPTGIATYSLPVTHATLPKGQASLSVVATVTRPAPTIRSTGSFVLVIN